MSQLSRREMLKLSMVGATVLAVNSISGNSHAAYSKVISLEECSTMTPQEIAQASGYVMNSWDYLIATANSITEPFMKKTVLEIINNPAPNFLQSCDKKEVYKELKALGLTSQESHSLFPPVHSHSKSIQPFYSATGSGWTSHHAYPGGLATHTAFNVKMAIAMADNYKKTYNFEVDKDIVIAAQILHDLHKPWVFQWQENNSCRTEQVLANTGEHHVLSLAESIHRGLSSDLVIAQAGAHIHPGNAQTEASVVHWLKAAAIINGKDPVALGLLAQDGKTLPLPRKTEAFITHVADHDYVLSVPALQWLLPVMKKIAQNTYNIKESDLDKKVYNNLRNYVFAQVTAMTLYQEYVERSEKGVETLMLSLVSPV